MCGIVGAVVRQDALSPLLEGLHRLEYRGYDSAGVATVDPVQGLQCVRVAGKVRQLEDMLLNGGARKPTGGTGLAHTRWATHGKPNVSNAHPHVCDNNLALVHNGIIENYQELREQLLAQGHEFASDTDSEVIVKLIHSFCEAGASLLEALRSCVGRLSGSYALGVISQKEPGRLLAVRCGSPLIVGIGDEGNYIASDIFCLLPYTRKFVILEEGDIADIRIASHVIYNHAGEAVQRTETVSDQDVQARDKGNYRHFMLKEIFAQPQVLHAALDRCLLDDFVVIDIFGSAAREIFPRVRSVTMVACGTSYHAGLVARYWLQEIAGVPCSVEIASEFRYTKPIVPEDCLLIAISQSGETADTLGAIRKAKECGYAATLAICNVPESSLIREADLVFLTRAGVEIGVASTKAFTTQLMGLFLFVLAMAQHRGIPAEARKALGCALSKVPQQIQRILEQYEKINALAEDFSHVEHVLYLGRNLLFPVAMEGALKLKEVSYIHAEAYAAGELKHGPLALIEEDVLVVGLLSNNTLKDKMLPNLAEVKARGGKICLFADDSIETDRRRWTGLFRVPTAEDPFLSPLLHTVPLQILAYCIAVLKGADVDQPRNLAKSVTVE